MQRLFFLLVLILCGASAAIACSCFLGSHSQNFSRSKAVFIGRLIQFDSNEINRANRAPLYQLRLKVEKKWKGARGDEVTVFTNGANMCSAFTFQEGESYLLYVEKDSFVTSDCSSSVEIDSVEGKARIKDLNSFWFRLKADLRIF